MSEVQPEKAALILSEQIYGHLKQITDGQQPDGPTKAEIVQLYNSAGSLLVTEGYSAIATQAQLDNERYFTNLFMWATSTRMLDQIDPRRPGSKLIEEVMRQIIRDTRVTALTPPKLESYCEGLPEPYQGLLATWFTLDTFIQKGRYQRMLNAANRLIGQ